MPKLSLLVGSTSNTINVFVQDSSSTIGAGLSGLAYNTSGITAYYALPRAAPVAITLATQTVTGAFSSGGFVELDATHTKGLYRLDIPDAAVASGRFANVYLYGATNMAPVVLEIELTATNNQDGVHGGMSALPNTACTTNASLVTSGTGTDQLSVTSGRIDIGKALGTAITLDANNVINVSAKYWAGTAITATSIPVATAAGASGGLLIAASNAATTFATLTSTGAFTINGTSNVAQTGDAYAIVNSGTFGNSALHTQIGSPWQVGTKYGVTLAASDVTGNVAADLQTIKTQAVTCAAGVTVGAFVGNATHAITVDGSGNVTFNNTSIATVTNLTNLPSIPAGWITAAGIASGALVAAVWDGSASGHTTGGTFGGELAAAGGIGDPWSTALPGAYGAGTAGYIVGTNLDATVSSRSTYAGADTSGTTTLLSRLTSGRATNLDNLDAAVSSRSTYAGTDTPGTTTLLARITVAPPTAAVIATAVLTNTTDNTTVGSPGKILAQLGGTFTTTSSSIYSTAALANGPTGGTAPTAPQNAAAVWQALLAGGDFGTAGSIGLLLATDIDAAISSRSTYAGGPVASVTSSVSVLLTQTLSPARALDAVADTALTVNDALQCAVASVSAQVDASNGTSLVLKTASTGTTLRTKALTLVTPPPTVPNKAI